MEQEHQSKAKRRWGHLKLFLFKQTSLNPTPILFSSGICLASHPCLLCWLTQCLALLNPLRSAVIRGARGHDSREERPVTPAAQRDSSRAIRFWPVVTHNITAGVWFLLLFPLSNTHTHTHTHTHTLSLSRRAAHRWCRKRYLLHTFIC